MNRWLVSRTVVTVGVLLVTLGALGTWARGDRIDHHVMGEDTREPLVVEGWDQAGWVVLLPSVAGTILLWSPGRRDWGALFAFLGFTVSLLLAAWAATDPVDFPALFTLHIFESFDVHLAWGLPVAALGSILGMVGANWAGTPRPTFAGAPVSP